MMEKERFIRFRTDLAKLRDFIMENPRPQYVRDILKELALAYPELDIDERRHCYIEPEETRQKVIINFLFSIPRNPHQPV